MEVTVWGSFQRSFSGSSMLMSSLALLLCNAQAGSASFENEPCAKGSLIEHFAMTRLCCCQDEAVATFAVSLFRALQSRFDFMLRHSDRWKVAHESCNAGQAALTGFSGHRNW